MAEVKMERLRQIPLTWNLTEEEVNSLQPRVQELLLRRGEIVFRQGDPAFFFYFVEEGQISEVGRDPGGPQTVHRRAGPGEYLGRYALVTGRPFRVTATADKDTTLLAIRLRDLQPILFSYPDWRDWFFHIDIAARLRAIPLFKAFNDWDIYLLADQAEVREYAAGESIFHAGEPADSFYIIDRGQVIETAPPVSSAAGDWPRYFAAGNYFGRHSVLHDQPRRATAVARKATRLFRIPGQTLKELLAHRAADLPAELQRSDVVARLGGVPLFSGLPGRHLRLLAGYASLVLYRPGDIVARQGEPATSLMILDEGEAVVRLQVGQGRPRPVTYLKARWEETKPSPTLGWPESTYFGAHALLAEELRGATVEVTQPSTWIVLGRSDFQRFLADAGLTPGNLGPGSRPDVQVSTPPPVPNDQLDLPYKTRRHWIVLVRRLFALVVALTVAIILLVADLVWPDLPAGLRSSTLLIGVSVILGLLVPWTVWRYLNWRNDTFEVTAQAVVRMERVPFPFPREDRYEAPLQQIQNVNIFVSALGRILGYGDLSIDTAAVEGQVEFTEIPQPATVQNLIRDAAGQARGGQQIQFREGIRQQLEDHLYPERIRPAAPGSVLIPPPPPPPPPPRRDRLRWLTSWLPQLEIRAGDQITWRKHWLNLISRAGAPSVACLIMLYLVIAHLLAFAAETFGLLRWQPLPPVSWLGFQAWSFLLSLLLGLAAIVWFIYHYVDWRNDVYIVTDDEVIDVERKPVLFPFWFFYSEDRKQAPLEMVQNVNLRVPHLLAVLLNYGDVIVQTAGVEGSLDFLFVSNPRHVQAEVTRRLAAYRERKRQREFEERGKEIAGWFGAYHSLNSHSKSEPGAPAGGPSMGIGA